MRRENEKQTPRQRKTMSTKRARTPGSGRCRRGEEEDTVLRRRKEGERKKRVKGISFRESQLGRHQNEGGPTRTRPADRRSGKV